MGDNERQQVEAAVADIQLLGSAGQVKLAAEFAKRIAAEGTAGTEPLLQDLRSSLRRDVDRGGHQLDPRAARSERDPVALRVGPAHVGGDRPQ